MPVTTESIDIACAPEDVYVLLTHPVESSKLSDNFRELRDFHGGEAQVGDTWVLVNQFMGRDIVATYTFLEAVPSSKIVFKNESDSAEIHMEWTMEAIDGGTRLNFFSEGNPKGFFATLALNLVKGNYDQSVRDLMSNIKAKLEG